MKHTKSSIQTTVMQQISDGRVRMHSRLYFSIITAVSIVAGLAGGALITHNVSIATFMIRIQGASTPAYGARSNLAEAIGEFPWWLVVVAGLMIAVAIWMMRRYGRAYRHERTPLVAIFLLASVVLGISLSFVNTDHNDTQDLRGNSRRSVR